MALHEKTVSELAAGLEAGDFSSVEVTEALLERIAASDEKLNALITVTGEQALATAKQADAARAAGTAGALNGIPLIHKDIFLHARRAHELWLEDAGRIRFTLRCNHRRAARRGRRGHARQGQHG